MDSGYTDFLASKQFVVKNCGIEIDDSDINQMLFPFQRDMVRWALRKGTAAIFADTGMGKTFQQIEWSRLTGQTTLIIAPLSVAKQTIGEAKKLGLVVQYCRSMADVQDGLNITNYEMLEHFTPERFGAVVLDESSILKGLDGKTRQRLTDMFIETPYKLCCTATPAPNDITEIANHAEFLGIMSRANMLAAFFVHDDDGWRLKGHAEKAFYKWLASWGMSLKKPSDLGYSDDGFILPELSIIPEIIEAEYTGEDRLFWTGLKGISDRITVRKNTMALRVDRAAELIQTPGQWLCWVGMNDEGRLLQKLIPGAALMEGSDRQEKKLADIEGFQNGSIRVLITKPKIAGFGMNFQNCNQMVFVGLGDSFESYYQCIRRCYRFGQLRPVTAHIVLSDMEEAVYQNVLSKEQEAQKMSKSLIDNIKEFEQAEIGEMKQEFEYATDTIKEPEFTLMLGDSVERITEIESDTVGLSVFSPPFISLYTYSPTERDIGNCKNDDEFYEHFGFIIRELLRITKPGRNACVHVAQVPAMLSRDGFIGLKDFRGGVIRHFVENGWVYHGEVCIDKDPQAQAIRTHSKALLFAQLRKDSSWSRPALADYILIFRKPGENVDTISPNITNDEWIEWARPIWYGIRETDTLNFTEARENADERHICPLQLGTIERCIKLWSNPGDLVFDPFNGIGSTGYVSLKNKRRYTGIELKPTYYRVAGKNLYKAKQDNESENLFSAIGG